VNMLYATFISVIPLVAAVKSITFLVNGAYKSYIPVLWHCFLILHIHHEFV
jgi:hypothetical protein